MAMLFIVAASWFLLDLPNIAFLLVLSAPNHSEQSLLSAPRSHLSNRSVVG